MSELDYTMHVSAQDMLEQLDGAQIATVSVEERTGLHIHFRDGRVLVIVGLPDSSIGVQVLRTERLH
jgi:predicted Zn-dependent protease